MKQNQVLAGLPQPAKLIRAHRCETCKYAEREGGVSKNYACHKGPPAVSILPSNKGPMPLTAFPMVQPDQWCGAFEPKIENVN